MNLIAVADQPLGLKIVYFMMVMIPTIALTLYTVAKTGRLSEFLEVLSSDRDTPGVKVAALARVWRPHADENPEATAATAAKARVPAHRARSSNVAPS